MIDEISKFAYLKYAIGSSQLPSLITVERSANVWIICSCGIDEFNDNASPTMSDSFVPPVMIPESYSNVFFFFFRFIQDFITCCTYIRLQAHHSVKMLHYLNVWL